MKTGARWIFSLLLLCLPTSAWAAVEVKEVTTPSGLRAWLVEDNSLPLVSIKIAFRDAGSASDPQALAGRAYLAGEAIFEGSGGRDALSFQRELETRAIRLSTAVDEDLFKISASVLSEQADATFGLIADMILRPRLAAADIARLQEQTLGRLRQMESSPGYALGRAFETAAYGSHPYAQPTMGIAESVVKLKPETLSDFIRRHLTRDRITLAVVGDINAQQLSALLEKYFAALPATAKPDQPVKEAAPLSQGKIITVEKNIPQTLVAFGLNGLRRTDENYFPAYIMNQVLGGGGSLNSRLGDEIRENRGLAYSVGSALDTKLHAGILSGQFATRSDKADEALEHLRRTLRDVQKNGVKEEEVEDAKRYIIGSFPLNLDSNDEVASYLISMQLYGLGQDYLNKRNDLVRAVTHQSVNDMAKKFLREDEMLVVRVGKPAADGKTAETETKDKGK